MARRILEQYIHSIDRERLINITVFEEGIKKEDVKKINNFSKKHKVIILDNGNFKYKGNKRQAQKEITRMYEKGDIIIVNNKAHKLHNKPCMIIGTGRNWLKEVCYFATPLDLKIKPRSYSFTLNETIYTNPYALLELAERLGDFEYKNHIIKKFKLKDVKKDGKKPI